MNARLIPMTDDRGRCLLSDEDRVEPLPGSIVLTEGHHGTAWQLFFSDRRWHPTRGGGSKSWGELLNKRNVVLVYDAPERENRIRASV